jgi:CheY-like chemotaxis protein
MDQGQAHKRVLVVEDDVDIQEALAQLLENEGYTVTSADNGLNAMSYLHGNEQPCVILLDLMMPIMDGWQFRAEQRKDPKLANIPIVVLSAHGAAPQHAAALEAVTYLKKPIDLDLLLATVKRFCG